MPVLTEIVLASEAEAAEVLRAEVPAARWKGFDARGVDEGRLGRLWALLDGGAGRGVGFPVLAGQGEDGPRVQRVPPALVAWLAAIEGERLAAVAAAWGAGEAPGPGLRDHQDLADVLEELVNLAHEAVARGQALLLWSRPAGPAGAKATPAAAPRSRRTPSPLD